MSGLRTPGTHGQTQWSSKDALGEEKVLVLGHGGGAETVSEQGQCWYRDSVRTGTVWVQRQHWCRDSVRTGTVLVQRQCWYRDSVGAGTVLVQQHCWCRDGVGAGMVLVQGRCWYRDGVGAGTVLVQGRCWCRDSAGTKASLNIFWEYSPNSANLASDWWRAKRIVLWMRKI